MQTIMEAVFELIARRQRARCADRRGALSRTIAALADEMKLPLTGIAIIVLAPWAIYRAQTPTLERVICEAINGPLRCVAMYWEGAHAAPQPQPRMDCVPGNGPAYPCDANGQPLSANRPRPQQYCINGSGTYPCRW